MDERLKQTLVLAREYYGKREYDKAEPLLREVVVVEDRLADVHDMLGVIAHARGNLVVAEHHFERALAINPAYTEAALNLAVTYNDRGKYDAAREIQARLHASGNGSNVRLDPFARGKLANMHADLANAYAEAGLKREAIDELEKAVRLCPQFADLRTRLGALYREVSDLDAAKSQCLAAIDARPTYVPARIQLGVVLAEQGDAQAAEAEWVHALELEPDNARAKMYLRRSGTLKVR